MVNFLNTIPLLLLAAALPAEAHVKSTLQSLSCKSALGKYNFGCGKNMMCMCTSDLYIPSYVKCLLDFSNSEAEVFQGFGHMLEKCNKMKMESKITDDDFINLYNTAVEKDAFVNASSVANKTQLQTHPLIFTAAEIKFVAADNDKFLNQIYVASLYGGLIMVYWAFVFVVATIFNLIKHVAPKYFISKNSPTIVKFRKLFTLPAAFGYNHTTGTFLGIIPTRAQSLVLLGYFIMNLVLCLVHYDFLTTYESHALNLSRYIGDRTGIISFAHFPIVFLFAGRNNFLLWCTGWSFDTFNTYHRWVSRMMILHAFIHSVAWSVYCTIDGSYKSMFTSHYWNYGVAATVFGCVIIFQSARFFRTHSYEIFLVLHTLLAIAYTVGCVWHSYYMGWMQWIWAAIAIWAFDRFVRLGRVAYNGICISDGKLFKSATSTDGIENSVFKLSIKAPSAWTYKPGSHVYLHVFNPLTFWQSHPFTVYHSPNPSKAGELVLCAKTHKGLTRAMARDFASHPNGYKEGFAVGLDGPYGHQHNLDHYDTVVFIAGGIGVTATYSYAADMVSNGLASHNSFDTEKQGLAGGRPQHVIFVWVARDESVLDWFGSEIEYLANSGEVDVELYLTEKPPAAPVDEKKQIANITSESLSSSSTDIAPKSGSTDKPYAIHGGRPNIEELVATSIRGSIGSTAVMVCGPSGLNDSARQAVTRNLGAGAGRVDYFEEAFSW